MKIEIEIIHGKDIVNYTKFISQLRIDVFADFPYLYKGDLAYERKYMIAYETHPHSTIAIAKVDGEIAAVSTGIPLSSEAEIISGSKELFDKLKLDIEKIYYYGEIITIPKFRGLKLSAKLLEQQDDFIRQQWGFTHTSILTVVREEKHPLKPADYQSSDRVWERIGFSRTGIQVKFYWPTFQVDGSVKEEEHFLEFWVKSIAMYRLEHVARAQPDSPW